MIDLHDAKEHQRRLKPGAYIPWKNDQVLVVTEDLPAAKVFKKARARLEKMQPRIDALAQGVDALAQGVDTLGERLEAERLVLTERRQSLKAARQESITEWSTAFLRGEQTTPAEVERIGGILDTNLCLRGCRAVEVVLNERRGQVQEYRERFAAIERELDSFDESERLTRQARDALLKIDPFDQGAPEEIEILKAVIRKCESSRRGADPDKLGRTLDELEAVINEAAKL